MTEQEIKKEIELFKEITEHDYNNLGDGFSFGKQPVKEFIKEAKEQGIQEGKKQAIEEEIRFLEEYVKTHLGAGLIIKVRIEELQQEINKENY